jgi:hypothetical protein
MIRLRALALGAAAVVTVVAVHGAVGHSGKKTTARNAGYVNPLAGEQWTDARTDQGVDYQPAVPEPVRAIGAGVVVYSSTSDCLPHGWPGCAVIGYRLTAGSKKGAVIYVAEHLEHLLPEGARVRPGTVLATALPGYPWIEAGWANCAGNAPVVQYDGAGDGTPMAGGLAFARFMRELGASTAMNPGPGPDVKRCR